MDQGAQQTVQDAQRGVYRSTSFAEAPLKLSEYILLLSTVAKAPHPLLSFPCALSVAFHLVGPYLCPWIVSSCPYRPSIPTVHWASSFAWMTGSWNEMWSDLHSLSFPPRQCAPPFCSCLSQGTTMHPMGQVRLCHLFLLWKCLWPSSHCEMLTLFLLHNISSGLLNLPPRPLHPLGLPLPPHLHSSLICRSTGSFCFPDPLCPTSEAKTVIYFICVSLSC